MLTNYGLADEKVVIVGWEHTEWSEGPPSIER